MMIAPGSTIGIIGGGQLGRMMAVAAAQLGYDCHVFDPHESPAAARVAARFTRGDFGDSNLLRRFAEACDVVTYEFENLDCEPLRAIEHKLRPGIASLEFGQDRALEKRFVEECGGRPAPWREVNGAEDIVAALEALGAPVLLKTRRLGYDGKGQTWVRDPSEASRAWHEIGKTPCVAEARVDFEAEFSVVIARSEKGETRAFPLIRNCHREGILRLSEIPGGAEVEAHASKSCAVAERIAEQLGHIGVLTVEFFATADGALVNEFAPRVHNSGHWTIEGAATSQFEQHVRAICGLPLGETAMTGRSASMENLIGNDIERWPDLVAEPGAHLHIYGKGQARRGRKMGHVTRVCR